VACQRGWQGLQQSLAVIPARLAVQKVWLAGRPERLAGSPASLA
jgi:hypothetical protein